MSSSDGKGRLLLVRHTESTWNKLNVSTGWVDVPLSEIGKKHALLVGEAMRGHFDVDVAFTSGLVRAQQTLDLVMQGMGIADQGVPVTQDWRLNERFYGGWQGKNKDETAKKYGEEQFMAVRRGYSARPPGGESLADTVERVLPYFESDIEPLLAEGKTVLVAAHGNSLRALAGKLENLSEDKVPGFVVGNGELLVYRYEDGGYVRETFAPQPEAPTVA